MNPYHIPPPKFARKYQNSHQQRQLIPKCNCASKSPPLPEHVKILLDKFTSKST